MLEAAEAPTLSSSGEVLNGFGFNFSGDSLLLTRGALTLAEKAELVASLTEQDWRSVCCPEIHWMNMSRMHLPRLVAFISTLPIPVQTANCKQCRTFSLLKICTGSVSVVSAIALNCTELH